MSVDSLRKMYYGWWIVIATFCILFVCAGIGFFSLPVFLKFIDADTHWGRDKLSNAGAFAALAAGFATPVIGYLVDRFGTRSVMMPGAVILSASYLLLSRVTSILHLYILFLIIGIGMAATTILPSQTLISRWFERRRGRAMGAITLAGGLGGMLWMPLSTRLIESIGWRNAYGILGIIILVIPLPLIWLIIRNSPRSMGLTLDGETNQAAEADPPNGGASIADAIETGYTTGQALRTMGFWLIVAANLFAVFASSGFGLHAVAFLSDSGLSSRMASGVWSTVIGVSIGGTIFFGFFSEKRQKRFLASGSQIVRAFSLLTLVLFALNVAPRSAAIGQLVLVYGLGLGCINVVSPLLLSETFGVKAFGKLMGLLGIPFTIGMALGQIVAGKLFVSQNNYKIAFAIFALAFLLSGISLILVKPYFLLDSRSSAQAKHP